MQALVRGAFAVSLCASVTTLAEAQPSSTFGTPEQTRQAKPGKAAHTHDGFYLRLGVSVGGLQTQSSFEGSVGSLSADQAIGEITYSGVALGLDFVIGGTLLPGFVLGYGLEGQIAPSPTVSIENTPTGDHKKEVSALGTSLHGLAIDVFPDPNGNLELGGLLGLAHAGTGSDESLGWGATLWGGYGIWADDDVSLVTLLRLGYTRTTSQAQSVVTPVTGLPSTIDRTDSTFTAGVVAAFLLH